MTALDQAFIKAYSQHDRKQPPSSAQVDRSDRCVSEASSSSQRSDRSEHRLDSPSGVPSPAAAVVENVPKDVDLSDCHGVEFQDSGVTGKPMEMESSDVRSTVPESRSAVTTWSTSPGPTLGDLGILESLTPPPADAAGLSPRSWDAPDEPDEPKGFDEPDRDPLFPLATDVIDDLLGGPKRAGDDSLTEESLPADHLSSDSETPAEEVEQVWGIDPADPWKKEFGRAEPDEDAMRPLLRVDRLVWSADARQLGREAMEQVDELADGILVGMTKGRRVIAVSSVMSGSGCTTVMLCVARRLAERGITTAVVDADFDTAELASRLGLDPEVGWEDVLSGKNSLSEVLIESERERIIALPLVGRPLEDLQHRTDPGEHLRMLQDLCDVVLVDLGVFQDARLARLGILAGARRHIDGVILVDDVRQAQGQRMADARRRLRRVGMTPIGIVENFVRAAGVQTDVMPSGRAAG